MLSSAHFKLPLMLSMYDSLFARLQPDDCIITVNQRLARYLRVQYAEYLVQQGQAPVFPAEQIMTLNHWAEATWAQAMGNAQKLTICLSSAQEACVWQHVIADSGMADDLLSINSVIPLVQQAWQTLCWWDLPVDALARSRQVDVKAFHRWVTAFRVYCQQRDLISAAEIPVVLGDYAADVPTINTVYTVGFSAFAPRWQQCLTVLGCEYVAWELPSQATQKTYRVPCEQAEVERVQACQWAKDQLQRKAVQKVAIVVPMLQQDRQAWRETVDQVLVDSNIVVNISGGQPLLDHSLVQTAYDVLQWMQAKDVRPLLQSLLRSPFVVQGVAAAQFRAQWAQQLQVNLHQPLDRSAVLRELANMDAYCGSFLQALQQLPALALDARQPLLDWCQYFESLWQAFGWPGERTLNSWEYQLWTHCRSVLHTLPTWQCVLPDTLTYREAVAYWVQAMHVVFQPETTGQAQLEILGLLEVAGLPFDAIWVTDMHVHTLPQPVVKQPFLPLELQRRHAVPHVKAAQQYQAAQSLIQQLQKQTKCLLMSYTQWVQDQVLLPSALIASHPSATLPPPVSVDIWPAAVALETHADTAVPALTADELADKHYSSAVLQAQALCPFQAMVRYRWRVQPVEAAAEYLDPRWRGSILHEILEYFWQQVGTQAALKDLQANAQAYQVFIAAQVSQTLARWARRYPVQLSTAVCALEQQRLCALLEVWLQQESARPAFAVLSLEETLSGDIGPLQFQVRTDRRDRLADGQDWVLDYKTGQVSTRAWWGARPSDPQLSLYAVLTQSQGVVYACLHPRQLTWHGIVASAAQDSGLLDITTLMTEIKAEAFDAVVTWEDLLAYWRQQLSELATQFAQGYAVVDPKSTQEACRYCDLQMLCRVEETL